MKPNLNLAVLLTVLALAGCQKNIERSTGQNTSEATMSIAKASGTGNSTVYLRVTVDETPGNQILSDNNGAYINGTDRVEAQILSSDGNFYMNTNNNTVRTPIRIMRFLPDHPEIDLSGKRNYSLRTAATIWLQNMTVGSVQNVGFRAWGVQQGGVVDWRLLYRSGYESTSSSLTDYAKVTRTTADEWTIEPANFAGVTFANARLIDGNDPPNPLGSEYYQVPFKLTLTRLAK